MDATIPLETAAVELPPDRGMRYFMAHQNSWSWAALILGIGTVLAIVGGTIGVLDSHGWTQQCPEGVSRVVCSPSDPLAEGFLSDGLGSVILATFVVGIAAGLVGIISAFRYQTRPQREATVAGAVLAVQGVLLAVLLIAFRGSDVEVFTRNFLDVSLLGNFWERFVSGAKNTLILSLAGAALGFFLGLILSLFTLSKRAVIRAPARVYINFFRGTPLIWQLSFAGLGVVAALDLGWFRGTEGPYRVAIVVLGLNLAAYSAEVYRAGIQSLERGQIEAARSLGLSYGQAMWNVIIPQAIRRVIPPLTNEFVILIKDTSLVIVLGLAFAQKELLGVGRDIYNSEFNATAWLGSAAGFLIITLPMIRLVTILEKRLRSGLTSVVGH
jgi:polar amino acid transport system permease protein